MAELVSVIVPVYNAEQFLEKCVTSILKQTYWNLEIILVDDASTDHSRKVCQILQKKDDRIKLILNDINRGPSAARNDGMNIAKGEFLFFVDSDDYIDKETIMKVADRLREGYDVCSFCARRFDEEGNYLYEMRFDEMIKEIDFEKCDREVIIDRDFMKYKAGWEAWMAGYNRKFLEKYNIRFDENIKIGEDMRFTMEYLKYCRKWIKIPDILYNYIKRSGSMVNIFERNNNEKENIGS